MAVSPLPGPVGDSPGCYVAGRCCSDGDCQEFCAGGRLPSLDDEALTEDYGELTFGLTPFARWALPFVRRVIEHEI